MNYKVTFYNDEMEMLTERKANFVNILKKNSSQIIDKLGGKLKRYGNTTGEAIKNFIEEMSLNETKQKNITVEIGDIPLFYTKISNQNTNKNFHIIFSFKNKGVSNTSSKLSVSGTFNYNRLGDKLYTGCIHVDVQFIINQNNKLNNHIIIDKLHKCLVHELQHASDELHEEEQMLGKKPIELNDYEEQFDTKFFNLKYINYFLKGTEIRSHINEAIYMANARKSITPERIAKTNYKNAYDLSKLSGRKMKEQDKLDIKDDYSFFKTEQKNLSFSKNVSECLKELIKEYCGILGRNVTQFIFDYHISFIKESNEVTKQRYYNKSFSDIKTFPLKHLKNFLGAMYDVFLTAYDFYNTIETLHELKLIDKKIFEKMNSLMENVWDKLSKPFNNYDSSLLVKEMEKLINDFKNKHNINLSDFQNYLY